MKETFILRYLVTYNADSPIQSEECMAEIKADNFEAAYDKAKALADELRMSPSVLGVVIRSLNENVRRKTIWQKS